MAPRYPNSERPRKVHLRSHYVIDSRVYLAWCGRYYDRAHITDDIAKVECNTCRKKYAASLLKKKGHFGLDDGSERSTQEHECCFHYIFDEDTCCQCGRTKPAIWGPHEEDCKYRQGCGR